MTLYIPFMLILHAKFDGSYQNAVKCILDEHTDIHVNCSAIDIMSLFTACEFMQIRISVHCPGTS